MFSSYTCPRVGTKSFSLVQHAFLQADDLPFRDVPTEEEIQTAFVAEDACFGEDEDDIYTPALTVWGWLAQVMQAEKARSCVTAVARIAALCVALASVADAATLSLHAQTQHLGIIWSRVGHRPNRVEPRAIKRRPKPHKLLNRPRDEAREKLISGRGARC
jgi:hypothetical protein